MADMIKPSDVLWKETKTKLEKITVSILKPNENQFQTAKTFTVRIKICNSFNVKMSISSEYGKEQRFHPINPINFY